MTHAAKPTTDNDPYKPTLCGLTVDIFRCTLDPLVSCPDCRELLSVLAGEELPDAYWLVPCAAPTPST